MADVIAPTNLEDMQAAAHKLISEAKRLARRVFDAVEDNNFSLATILLTDMTIAANRADAAKMVLHAIKEENASELDWNTTERLLARLTRDARAAQNRENSPSFLRVIEEFKFFLKLTLDKLDR